MSTSGPRVVKEVADSEVSAGARPAEMSTDVRRTRAASRIVSSRDWKHLLTSTAKEIVEKKRKKNIRRRSLIFLQELNEQVLVSKLGIPPDLLEGDGCDTVFVERRLPLKVSAKELLRRRGTL